MPTPTHYRIRAKGDGITNLDSVWVSAAATVPSGLLFEHTYVGDDNTLVSTTTPDTDELNTTFEESYSGSDTGFRLNGAGEVKIGAVADNGGAWWNGYAIGATVPDTYTVRSEIKAWNTTVTTTSVPGIVGGMTDVITSSIRFGYYARIRSSNFELYRVDGFNTFVLLGQSPVPGVANGYYKFYLTVTPTNIIAGLNDGSSDVEYHNIADATYRGNRFGVYGRNAKSSPDGIIYRRVSIE